jgi:segregation and condensation protein A
MQQVAAGHEPMLSNYQLRLPAYEGPLDVLLRLIERSQLAIEDVSLVAVTNQFLAFVAGLESAPSSVIAEFASVGARLTVLKSRSLLPRPVVDSEEPEQSDLTHQLREYKRVKDLARHLGMLHARGANAFGPGIGGAVARPPKQSGLRLAPHEASSLVRSLRRRLTVIPRQPAFIRQRRVVSLRDLVVHVADCVTRSRRTRFSSIVSPFGTRTEVATAFLAVLVLIRRQAVEAAQGDLFGDIALGPGTAGSTLDSDAGAEEFMN